MFFYIDNFSGVTKIQVISRKNNLWNNIDSMYSTKLHVR